MNKNVEEDLYMQHKLLGSKALNSDCERALGMKLHKNNENLLIIGGMQ
jgi:hypothetical protein